MLGGWRLVPGSSMSDLTGAMARGRGSQISRAIPEPTRGLEPLTPSLRVNGPPPSLGSLKWLYRAKCLDRCSHGRRSLHHWCTTFLRFLVARGALGCTRIRRSALGEECGPPDGAGPPLLGV